MLQHVDMSLHSIVAAAVAVLQLNRQVAMLFSQFNHTCVHHYHNLFHQNQSNIPHLIRNMCELDLKNKRKEEITNNNPQIWTSQKNIKKSVITSEEWFI